MHGYISHIQVGATAAAICNLHTGFSFGCVKAEVMDLKL